MKIIKIVPGVLICIFVAILSVFLSVFLGKEVLEFKKSPISPIMISIIIGLIISNFVKFSSIFDYGFQFSVKFILKLGIICLGIRLDIFQIFKIGYLSFPIVIISIISALLFVQIVIYYIKIPFRIAILIAVGTSICGASAILATAPVIKAKKEEISYAIGNISIFGVLAMFLYPNLVNFFFKGNEILTGLLIGTSIHETAQVTGASLIYSDIYNSSRVLDVATVTKLVRNLAMIIIVPFLSYLYLQREKNLNNKLNRFFFIKRSFPTFILGFIFLSLLRSIGDYNINHYSSSDIFLDSTKWKEFIIYINIIAEYSLYISMAALGLTTNLISIKTLGIKPFYVGFISSLLVGMVSLLSINLIKNFI